MPKKTKTMTKQAKGWITRRARAKAKDVTDAIANSTEVTKDVTINMVPERSAIIREMRKALNTVPAPMALVGGLLQPKRHDFAGELVLAARKKGGTEAVERLLEHHISTVVSDARDEAWRMHRRIWEDEAVRRRNRVIADFMMMATQHTAQVTILGSTTLQAIVEALEEAGYTGSGRNSPSEAKKATDAAAVR